MSARNPDRTSSVFHRNASGRNAADVVTRNTSAAGDASAPSPRSIRRRSTPMENPEGGHPLLPAEQLGEPVVAPSRRHGVLRSHPGDDELERGAAVIVEPPDHPRVP